MATRYGTHIIIDPKLAQELREFAFRKYKTGYGSMKKVAEKAIRNYLSAEG